jgi:hypothetical protein
MYSSVIYLIHCKNLYKYHNVPTPSTTTKRKNERSFGGLGSYLQQMSEWGRLLDHRVLNCWVCSHASSLISESNFRKPGGVEREW